MGLKYSTLADCPAGGNGLCTSAGRRTDRRTDVLDQYVQGGPKNGTVCVEHLNFVKY